MSYQITHTIMTRPATLFQGMALGLAVAVALLPTALVAQTVSGIVTDQDGAPLSDAAVFVEGTTHGDIADRTGGFAIRVPGAGTWVLVVSHLGYAPVGYTLHMSSDASLDIGRVVLTTISIGLPGLEIVATRKNEKRYARRFEKDLMGSTAAAKRATIMNPDVLSYYETQSGFRVVASQPIIVENRATGYRSTVHLHRYERFHMDDAFRLVSRVFFEEMATPNRRQRRLRTQLYAGSLQHFLWAWHHRRVRDEGFIVHSRVPVPATDNGLASAPGVGPLIIEYDAAPDKAYQAFSERVRVPYPFSPERQISRIQFADGMMVVAANGHSHTEVSQEGYWAFRGIGDRVPSPSEIVGGSPMAARIP